MTRVCCQEDTLASPTRTCPVEGPLLDGHISLLVELLMFRSVAERHHIGSKAGGERLIEVQYSSNVCAVDVRQGVFFPLKSHRL